MNEPTNRTTISDSDRALQIVTCPCGHELLDHYHHHMSDPQPCLVPDCDCDNFRGYQKPA